jgi:hypothetical protein
MTKNDWGLKAWVILKIVLAVSVTVLAWLGSLFFANQSNVLALMKNHPADFVTLSFGAASLALFALSILIAILGIFGWQAIHAYVQERVETATKEKIKIVESELRGRALSIQGYLLGDMSIDRKTLMVKDPERLDEAVELCVQGFDVLDEVGGPVRFMGMNNLVYYSCVRDGKSQNAKGSELLELARQLQKAAWKYQSANLLLTACRAVLQYGDDEKEKEDYRKILRHLIDGRVRAKDREKAEAQVHLELFP